MGRGMNVSRSQQRQKTRTHVPLLSQKEKHVQRAVLGDVRVPRLAPSFRSPTRQKKEKGAPNPRSHPNKQPMHGPHPPLNAHAGVPSPRGVRPCPVSQAWQHSFLPPPHL